RPQRPQGPGRRLRGGAGQGAAADRGDRGLPEDGSAALRRNQGPLPAARLVELGGGAQRRLPAVRPLRAVAGTAPRLLRRLPGGAALRPALVAAGGAPISKPCSISSPCSARRSPCSWRDGLFRRCST